MYEKVATIFGGTGFIGTQIVRELARLGYIVKVATRIPESAFFLKTCGSIGQIVPVYCDYSDSKSINQVIKGSSCVINCVGILFEKKKAGFTNLHTQLPEDIAKACKKEKVEDFIHISSLGCDKSDSQYAKTKLAGEKAARKAFPDVVVLRPSVVFGPGDSFLNLFARIARYSPFLPLIGGGNTKFQPVYVGDVADAVINVIHSTGDTKVGTKGQVYELGGPEIMDFREILQRLEKYTGRKRPLVSIPWKVSYVQAFFMSLLPKPLLTVDQVTSLKTDNVVSDNALTLADLGVNATGMDLVVPGYLSQYRAGGKFADKKRA